VHGARGPPLVILNHDHGLPQTLGPSKVMSDRWMMGILSSKFANKISVKTFGMKFMQIQLMMAEKTYALGRTSH